MSKLIPTALKAEREIAVRFSEVDSMQIVWHGNYVQYFEDGREAFGDRYDLNFLKIYEQYGLLTPIVKLSCDYKYSLRYGEKAIVETTYIESPAAKVVFDYRIFRASNSELVTTGRTIQVFISPEGELQLTVPPFLEEWKEKWVKGNRV